MTNEWHLNLSNGPFIEKIQFLVRIVKSVHSWYADDI